MAQLFFRLEAPIPADASVEVLINDQLEVPWPALVRVDHSASLLPTSRLLTERERQQPTDFFWRKSSINRGRDLKHEGGFSGSSARAGFRVDSARIPTHYTQGP